MPYRYNNRHFHAPVDGMDPVVREVRHKLSDVDFQYEVELFNLQHSNLGEARKERIKDVLKATHRSKRQPYVDLLNDLRRQQFRHSVAA